MLNTTKTKKRSSYFLGLASLMLAICAIPIHSAFASDLEVTCIDNPGSSGGIVCNTLPSAGKALFSEEETDNIGMLPGDTLQRTIWVHNKSTKSCDLVLSKVENIQYETGTLSDFSTKFWISLIGDGKVVYGGIDSNNEANSAKSLMDFFNFFNTGSGSTSLPIFSINANENETHGKPLIWKITFDPQTGNEYQKSKVWFDFDLTFNCDDNKEVLTPKLGISKYTPNWPNKNNPGSRIMYQITVNTKGSGTTVKNVTVTDLLPENFKYVAGSWNVKKYINGKLQEVSDISEPSYNSPGKWLLGDLEAEQTVVLEYTAEIAEDITGGIYKDIAFASGAGSEGKIIMATPASSGFEADGGILSGAFVGTQVLVDQPSEAPSKKISVPTKKIKKTEEMEETASTGEVLGTNTQILPATGATTTLSLLLWLGLGSSLTGLVLKVVVLKLRTTKQKVITPVLTLILAVILGFSWELSEVNAQVNSPNLSPEESLYLRISEPKTPNNKSFVVDYVALDINGHSVKITCYKKNPADTFFTILSQTTTKSGGDSGVCIIEKGDLPQEGLYTIKVLAETSFEGETSQKSQEISVLYNSSGPKRPKYVEKDKVDTCKYKIKVKTSEDAKNSYIEIYRSNKKDFTVGTNTRVFTTSVEPDNIYEFTHQLYGSDCGSSYYATRAFDDAGNPSDVRAEETEEIITVEENTKNTEKKETESESTSQESQGSQGTKTSNETNESEKPETKENQEENLNETEETNPKEQEEEGQKEVFGAKTNRGKFIWIIPAILLVIFTYVMVKSKRGESKPRK